jgi:hypothetical protein
LLLLNLLGAMCLLSYEDIEADGRILNYISTRRILKLRSKQNSIIKKGNI